MHPTIFTNLRRPRPFARLAALVLLAATVPCGNAKTSGSAVVVQLKKLGGGSPRKTATSILIVDASTTELVAASDVSAQGRGRLHPPATVALAIADVARPSGLREGVSDAFRFDPAASTVKLKIALGAAATGASAAVPSTLGASGATFAAPGSPVATLGPVTLSGPGFGPVPIDGPLFTPLFDETSDFIRWVDQSEAVLRARQRELDLQEQGLTDPSTQISNDLLPPNLRIDGELSVDGHTATGELRIVDASTGEVIARIPVNVKAGDWESLLRELARRLAARLRSVPSTTTTTTTTLTPTTTRPAPSTTTTLPMAGTCTSIIPASYCECVDEQGNHYGSCTDDTDCAVSTGGPCVDHVGHTLVTFRVSGSGGRLGALQIDGGDDGLVDVPGGVGVRIGCGSAGFSQGNPYPVSQDDASCPTYYHPDKPITVRARRSLGTIAMLNDPQHRYWCGVEFAGFSGGLPGCAGMGACDMFQCACTGATGTQNVDVVATYTSVDDGAGCVPPSAP